MTWIPDASALSDFTQCAEYFRRRHRQGYDAGSGLAAMRGSAWHAGAKTWFASPTSDVDAALATLKSAWTHVEVPGVPPVQDTLGFVRQLFEDYAVEYPRERDPFTVEASEMYAETDIPIPDDEDATFRYCGIRDRVIAHHDGYRYVMDTKTTGSYLTTDFFAKFALDPQMRGYVALQRALGEPVDGVYIDAICTRKSIGLNPRFVRHKVLYTDWQINDWAAETSFALATIATLDDIAPTSRWPQTGATQGRCVSMFGQECPFRPTCLMPAEIAEQEAAERFRVHFWNPREKAED